jgi:hypothetical protein
MALNIIYETSLYIISHKRLYYLFFKSRLNKVTLNTPYQNLMFKSKAVSIIFVFNFIKIVVNLLPKYNVLFRKLVNLSTDSPGTSSYNTLSYSAAL